jgi:hypothetical protein
MSELVELEEEVLFDEEQEMPSINHSTAQTQITGLF